METPGPRIDDGKDAGREQPGEQHPTEGEEAERAQRFRDGHDVHTPADAGEQDSVPPGKRTLLLFAYAFDDEQCQGEGHDRKHGCHRISSTSSLTASAGTSSQGDRMLFLSDMAVRAHSRPVRALALRAGTSGGTARGCRADAWRAAHREV